MAKKKARPKVQLEFPLVLIKWRDIADWEGWNDLSMLTDSNAPICHSVGFLLSRDEFTVRITETISPGDSSECFGMIKCIPTGCVVLVKKLR